MKINAPEYAVRKRPFPNSRIWMMAERAIFPPPHTFLIKLRGAGFFSNVNEVIHQLYLAERKNYRFVIDWSSSAYRSEDHSIDPWLYYFEPCFALEDDKKPRRFSRLPGGADVACRIDSIVTPAEFDRVCGSMLLPRNRMRANELINKYIRPHEYILNNVAKFQKKYFRKCMIGLHMRGSGRMDVDIKQARPDLAAASSLPLDDAFGHVDRILQFCPDAGVFVCSDSQGVIDQVSRKYGDRAVSYDSQRSDFGEMHDSSLEHNKGLVFDAKKLGEEVLTEALLLSRTDFFVHSFSNVSNFVLCANPGLFHRYVKI